MLGFPLTLARDFNHIWGRHVGSSVWSLEQPTFWCAFSMVFPVFLKDFNRYHGHFMAEEQEEFSMFFCSFNTFFSSNLATKRKNTCFFCNFEGPKKSIFYMTVVVACLSCESFFWCIGSSMYLRIAVALTYVLLLRLVRCPVPWKANCSVLLAQLWALPVVWLDDHQLFFCRFREPDVAFALRIVVADKKFIDWLRVGDLLEFLGSLWTKTIDVA